MIEIVRSLEYQSELESSESLEMISSMVAGYNGGFSPVSAAVTYLPLPIGSVGDPLLGVTPDDVSGFSSDASKQRSDRIFERQMLSQQIMDQQLMDQQYIDQQLMGNQLMDNQLLDNQLMDNQLMDPQLMDQQMIDQEIMDQPIMDHQLMDHPLLEQFDSQLDIQLDAQLNGQLEMPPEQQELQMTVNENQEDIGEIDEEQSSSRTRRERNGRREKIPEGTLCVVCSDLASGIHYTVASCNGCKTFFRRAVVNKQTFQCQFRNDCVVDKSVRCGCRSCRLKKCFHMGMDPNAIQHDRDKIRYTKRAKKTREEEQMEMEELVNGKPYMKEEVNSPNSAQSAEELANISSPSSSGVQDHHKKKKDYRTPPLPLAKNLLLEQEILEKTILLARLEKPLQELRDGITFPLHTSVACCLYDTKWFTEGGWEEVCAKKAAQKKAEAAKRKLLPDHLNKFELKEPGVFYPIPFDEGTLRNWYVRDLTLMIEWVKGFPLMDHPDFLLNDKLALIKTIAPMYPLFQLAIYSCKNDKKYSAMLSRDAYPTAEQNGSLTGAQYSSRIPEGYEGYTNIPTPNEPHTVDFLWYPDGCYRGRDDNQYPQTKKRPPIYSLILDSVCEPIIRLKLTDQLLILYKYMLYFNPDADGLSTKAKAIVLRERGKSLDHIYYQLNKERDPLDVMNIFASMLMITTTLQRIAANVKRTFDINHIFGNENDLIDQLIIIGL